MYTHSLVASLVLSQLFLEGSRRRERHRNFTDFPLLVWPVRLLNRAITSAAEIDK